MGATTAVKTAVSAAESLLITGDDRLAEQVAPLAAAAGHPLRRLTDPADARTRWQKAPLVVVGADAAEACLAHGLPERGGLILCTTVAWIGNDPTDASMLWPVAIRLRADHVIAVPEGREWLLDRFAGAARDTTPAPVAAAVAGHGGAGASTLALATATAAARDGRRTVLIDLDMTGGGIDTAAGLAAQPGWRWPSLAAGTGQLDPERLLAGLPQREHLHVVAPDPRNRAPLDPEDLERVLRAARTAADLVVLDLPRHRTDASARAAASSGAVAIAIGPSPRCWEAARAVAADYAAHAPKLGAVRRGTGARPEPPTDPGTADELDLPEWGTLPEDRRLATRLRQGRSPRRRTARRLAAIARHLSTQAPEPAGARR